MTSRPVILDTNFLLVPFQFKINIFEGIEMLIERSHHYVISSRTIGELEHLGMRIGKDGKAAKLALKMIEANKERIEIIENADEVDDWIVDFAGKNNAIVCTNDTILRRRLKERKIKIITMKSRSKLGTI